jgi:hypothetical protein
MATTYDQGGLWNGFGRASTLTRSETAPAALPKELSTRNCVDPCLHVPATPFPHNAGLRALDCNPKTGVARRLIPSIVEVRAHNAGGFGARVHQHQRPQQRYGSVFAESMFPNVLMKQLCEWNTAAGIVFPQPNATVARSETRA